MSLFVGPLSEKPIPNTLLGLIGRSRSREVLKVLAVGDDACETSL